MATDLGVADRAADRIYVMIRDIRRLAEAFGSVEYGERLRSIGPDAGRWHAIRGELGIGYDERRELTALIAGIIAEEMGR